MAACLVACAIFIAPSGQAHPEECLSGAATWTTVAGFDEEKFLAGEGCLPAAVTDRYDDSGAQLEAGEMVEKGLELVANVPKAEQFAGSSNLNSDLAFWGDYAFAGNYAGFRVYDISDPADPQVVNTTLCPGSQNDISVWNDLLFLSTDSSRSDDSCNSVGQDASIKESWEGIKIFDISDVANPRYIKSVETKCGSHTHTLLPDGDTAYLYVSSYSPNANFPDCQPPHDLISIVEVPLDDPTSASVVAEPVLFPDGGYDGANNYTRATAGCHDITVYPAIDLAAGACMGNGILMDISDPEDPQVLSEIFDENFAFWHSATFSNDGDKVLFTDERGGGSGAECNPTVGPTKGADAIYDIRDPENPRFMSYWKIPRTQANSENCVAHNGNVLPAPGRDIMVQAWYQGGVSVIDWTNGKKVKELAYFDRGPYSDAVPPSPLAGSWSSYWYNGMVYSNEIQRGFDVLDLTAPARANTGGRLPYLNAQTQEPLG
ncbi:MAG TPA: hypothetical protein VD836_19170 [Solirubrobacteraceae bacterium]|nr:hypothetical protein [Solirubrobacteraceae bacterium]